MWTRIDDFVTNYVDQDPKFDRKTLQEAYEDLQNLADIRDRLIKDYEYRSAMIALIWAATGDEELIKRLYSPDDETEDTTTKAYDILFEAAKAGALK